MNTVFRAPSGTTGVVQTAFGNATIGATGLVTVDSRATADLLNAGFTVHDDQDFEVGQTTRAGAHTVTAGENTANEAEIDTGLDTIVAMNVMILRAGINLSADAAISAAAGVITVADNSTDYVLGTGDVIHWIAVGTVA